MSRDEASYVADMVEACARVIEYTRGIDPASLRSDTKTVDAIVRNLQILGEAAKRVSAHVRASASDVPWREIAGMRDVLVHDYFGIDLDIVADVAFYKVPSLHAQLTALLAAMDRARDDG